MKLFVTMIITSTGKMYVVTEMHMGKKIRNYSYDYGVNFKW